jgi:SNF2 family DNA or RNA helicase
MTFWHDQQSNTMVWDTPHAAEILPLFEHATHLRNGYLAAPVSLYNCQVAQYCKLPTVPVVDQDYDWPIKAPWRPREHQKVMTEFMVQNPRCFNLSDMGTMKTLAALWAADYLMERNPGMRCLIVTPISTMQRTWGDAITAHFLGRRTYAILHGDPKKRLRELNKDVDFYIINYEGVNVGAKIQRVGNRRKVELGGMSKELASRKDIAICCIDEASAYRDGTTKRHLIARHVLAHKPYFWLMTGTPTSNGPLDAHGIARLVNNAFGESYQSYRKRIMYPISQFKEVPRVGAEAEAHKLLQPSIRYEMRECTDVPPCTEQMRDVELSDEQNKYYRELKRYLTLQLERGVVNAVNEAALRLKLIQISCGAVYDGEHRTHRLDCAPRLRELRAVIEEARRKVIIFTPLTSIVRLLYEDLKEYSRAMVNGEVPIKVRNEIFQKFQQDNDPQLIIADPAAMSHSLDLFAASVVCWYGAPDRTELYLQANRRIDRPGQVVPTTIVQLASTAVEREIYKRISTNTSMQGAILKMVQDQ